MTSKVDLLGTLYSKLNTLICQTVGEECVMRFGVELEFCFTESDKITREHISFRKMAASLIKLNKDNHLNIDTVEDEYGRSQFEVIFIPLEDPIMLVNCIEKVKLFLSSQDVSFEAKPFEGEPGNAMHVHFSLFTKDGINLLDRDPFDSTVFFRVFYNIIGGLLSTVNDLMYIFNPTEDCYVRLKYPSRNEFHFHYPTNCSWGFNNRTCAIRIPSTLSDKYRDVRIEHRVSSANADPVLALSAILYGMIQGIENDLEAPDAIYGRAFDHDYDHMESLCRNIHTAKSRFIQSGFYNLYHHKYNFTL